MINYDVLMKRNKIVENVKYRESERSNVVNRSREELYKFYICDYCGDEIKIKKKKYEMSGGICILPQSLTKRQAVYSVLCNKCLKKAIEELEG